MKKITLVLFLLLIFSKSFPQVTGNITFGTDTTLEIITWNIENFPKTSTTRAKVVEIINKMKVDFLALQEIKSVSEFNLLLEETNKTGAMSGESYLDLAFMYDTAVIKNVSYYRILTNYSCFTSAPQLIKFTYRNQYYYVINTHLKCCGDGILDLNNSTDEENRRYQSINLIKSYIETYLPDKRVFIVGDMNDELTDPQSNNVFWSMLSDTLSFRFVDMSIAQGTSTNWSYPSRPSHIDHICITNELFPENNQITIVTQTLKIDQNYLGGWSAYDSYVSDHRPVGIRIYSSTVVPPISDTNTPQQVLPKILVCYPNPSTDFFVFEFPKAKFNSNIEIFNSTGQSVFFQKIDENQTKLIWSAENQKTGIYFARFKFGLDNKILKIILKK